MRKLSILALILMFTGFAAAQVPTSGNVFVGYSYQNADASGLDLSGLSRLNMQGWEASLEGKVFPHIGIVADFSGHYGSEGFTELTPNGAVAVNVTAHEEDVLFGPRVSFSIGKLRPFAEIEGGIGHTNTNAFGSDTSWAWAIGGGVDYRIVRPVALRLEGDYVSTGFFSQTQENFRISTGIVFRF